METKAQGGNKLLKDLKGMSNKYGIVLVLMLLILVSSLLTPVFFTSSNLLNIMRQTCVITLIAFAEGSLILSGGIDLSAGATTCMCGLLAIPIYVATGSTAIALVASILIGVMLYAITGFFVAAFNVPAFVATLAMNMAVRGACKLYTGGVVITQTGENFTLMGQGYLFGIPIAVYVMLFAGVVLWAVLDRTRFGRNLFAVGGNPEAARASGINVRHYRFYSFIFAGAFIGLAGYMMASRVNSGIPTAGAGYEGQGISAAIIGGVGFAGGTGSAWGILVGAIIMGVISNILNLMQVDSYLQEVINGLIILVAVILDLQTKKKQLGK